MEISNKKTATGKGKTVPINRNKFTLAENYLGNKYDFRLNTVSLVIEYRQKDDPSYQVLNENSIFRELQNLDIGLSMTNLIALFKSDFVQEYDPFIYYFENLPQWNGTDYIQKLASFIKTKDQSVWENQFKKHLVRTVKCAIIPKYYNKQALILVDPRQNSGKSTFCRFLCPPALNEYIAEDINTDKDSRILIAKNFIINLDELALLTKSDLNSLKSFMSKDQINERLPYDRKSTILQRKASFVGSTNSTEFLTDETGSVRWLCFAVDSINWDYSKLINMDEVWSQAYYLHKSNFIADLSREEIVANEERNKRFHVLTVERELITKLFEFDYHKQPGSFLTATDVAIKINGYAAGLKINQVMVGRALKSLNCPDGSNTNSSKGYFLKYKDFGN